MQLKQLFIRYLKEMGYYGMVANYLCRKCSIGFLKNVDFYYLFYITKKLSILNNLNWEYEYGSFIHFFDDFCEPIDKIKKGDIITAKTSDGKYEFSYKVSQVIFPNMEVILDNGNTISYNRICTLNGREFNNRFKFKKDIIYEEELL